MLKVLFGRLTGFFHVVFYVKESNTFDFLKILFLFPCPFSHTVQDYLSVSVYLCAQNPELHSHFRITLQTQNYLDKHVDWELYDSDRKVR